MEEDSESSQENELIAEEIDKTLVKPEVKGLDKELLAMTREKIREESAQAEASNLYFQRNK